MPRETSENLADCNSSSRRSLALSRPLPSHTHPDDDDDVELYRGRPFL